MNTPFPIAAARTAANGVRAATATAWMGVCLAIAATASAVQSAENPAFATDLDRLSAVAESAADRRQPAASGPTGGVTFRFRGRIDTDAIWTTQSEANKQTFGDLGDAVGLRRARIGAEGNLGAGARHFSELDFASEKLVIRDVFIGLGDRQTSGEWRVGHMLEPFSLELGTSDNVFAFMERSPVNALDPERAWGVAVFRPGIRENSRLSLGVFRGSTDANDFQSGQGSTVGLTGRWTAAPVLEEDGRRLVHFGLASSGRLPESGVIRINQQPRSTLIEFNDSARSPFVPQISVPADFQQLFNAQIALVRGSFWTQAEWYGTWIDQDDGDPLFFYGGHVDCGYFLTGEHRRYLADNGTFGPLEVRRPAFRCGAARGRPRGWGAWELAARFSYLDFQDSDTPTGPGGQFVGIQLPQSTFGLNWYPADRVRLMFNYTYSLPDEPNTGAGAANVYGMRLGVFW